MVPSALLTPIKTMLDEVAIGTEFTRHNALCDAIFQQLSLQPLRLGRNYHP